MAERSVDLEIGGMTCASCASRIERRLNRLDGVTATVNFASEKARVAAPDEVGVPELVAAVESAGYSARPTTPRHTRTDDRDHDRVADGGEHAHGQEHQHEHDHGDVDELR